MSDIQDNTKGKFRDAVKEIRETLLTALTEATDRRYALGAKDRTKVALTGLAALQYQRLKPSLPNLSALIKERAYTLTNRLVILMSLEARGLRKVKLVSKGLENSAFRTEQEFFVDLCQGDDGGFGYVLQQVWDQLALELPALFAYDEIQECIPVPGPSLLWLLARLGEKDLEPAWKDDTTLGWLYQYWNDPDRKAVDEKLNTTTGKVEAHELAHKTQLFTERYMVEWLVQNSLGAQWLAICAKQGHTPQAHVLLQTLETRRKDWNQAIVEDREKSSSSMPVQGAEHWWKYYVVQDLGAKSVSQAPNSLQEVSVLDPAMGSGHFLVYVFDFLWELYQDQARLNGLVYTPEKILSWILTQNLHGIDIDNRAVQIGAAALYIKVQEKCPGFRIPQLNLVASDLGLAQLHSDDAAVQEFVQSLETELGLEKRVSLRVIEALRGADFMGSLLQIDTEIDRLIDGTRLLGENLVGSDAREKVMDALRKFIHDHDLGEDLGLSNLAGQLGKGLRLVEILGRKYQVIVANPPYLGTGKIEPNIAQRLSSFSEIAKGDLFTLFMARTDQLRDKNGISAFINMHSWMFLSSYSQFREKSFRENQFLQIAHMGRGGGFQDWADFDKVMQTTMFTWRSNQSADKSGWYCRLNAFSNFQKSVQLLRQIPTKTYNFLQSRFFEIPGAPMIYWWPDEFRLTYLNAKKLGEDSETKQGMATTDNFRFTRKWFEVHRENIWVSHHHERLQSGLFSWAPYIMGSEGNRWYATLRDVVRWGNNGAEVKNLSLFRYNSISKRIYGQKYYFQQGLAFSYTGTNGFLCRLRKFKSIFDVQGSSIFCEDPEKMQVILSSSLSGYVSQSLNPTIANQVGDIDNIPIFDLLSDYKKYLVRAQFLYDKLFASTESNLEYAYLHLDPATFEVEEARIRDEIDNEILAHFSADTAKAICQEIGESIFNFPAWDQDPATIPADFAVAYQTSENIEFICRKFRLHPDSVLQIKTHLGLIHSAQQIDEAFKHLSWAIGVLLGRFPAIPDSKHPHGLLYLSVLDNLEGLGRRENDNIGNQCLQTLLQILFQKWGPEKAKELWVHINHVLVGDKSTIGEFIRTEAFANHKSIYENRPIYFPLVSAKKNFFVWVNIHAWQEGTLNNVLANYLRPDLTLLESRIRRLREDSVQATDKKKKNNIENEVARLDKYLDELRDLVAKVSQLAEKGPAPKLQEVEAPYVMDLDDGVMVNSAALWELVQPLWKEPKKWWEILSKPVGKKDFDWSHLAMRYWPDRVYKKVLKDPSLAIAHGDYGAFKGRDLFEELHPKAALKWREQQKKGFDQEPELQLDLVPEAEEDQWAP